MSKENKSINIEQKEKRIERLEHKIDFIIEDMIERDKKRSGFMQDCTLRKYEVIKKIKHSNGKIDEVGDIIILKIEDAIKLKKGIIKILKDK